jgi:hypothetical protein
MMHNNDFTTKITILNNIADYHKGNEAIVKYIVQKGKVDNHYWVRKKAESITLES